MTAPRGGPGIEPAKEWAESLRQHKIKAPIVILADTYEDVFVSLEHALSEAAARKYLSDPDSAYLGILADEIARLTASEARVPRGVRPMRLQSALDEIDRLNGVINTLLTPASVPIVHMEGIGEVRLTKAGARCFGALKHRQGYPVTREALFEAIYFDRPEQDRPASMREVDAYIRDIRKQMIGSTRRIETVRDVGYRML